jgi:glycosyltransferase involved in cell wall biosynthesis
VRLPDLDSGAILSALRISIIIPAFNEERLIAETLLAVNAATTPFTQREWSFELIVCDNNSTDQTATLARAGGAKVVLEPVNQIARARNSGASAATGDWLIFVDADSKPSAGLFDSVAKTIEGGACLGGGSTVRMEGHHPLAILVVQIWNRVSRLRSWMAGSFIFCEAATFRKLRGFSQELFASEEIEFSQRLKLLAKERRKKVVILHEHPLLTSARKTHLYTMREHLWFLTKTIFGWGSTLRRRDACHTWYDGRR